MLAVASEVLAALTPWDGLEAGWLLIGTANRITNLIGAGPGAKRTTSSVIFDSGYQIAEMRRLVRRNNRLMILGVAHTHPPGRTRPSLDDFRTDSEWIERLPQRAGLFGIVTTEPHWFWLQSGDRKYLPIQVMEF